MIRTYYTTPEEAAIDEISCVAQHLLSRRIKEGSTDDVDAQYWSTGSNFGRWIILTLSGWRLAEDQEVPHVKIF